MHESLKDLDLDGELTESLEIMTLKLEQAEKALASEKQLSKSLINSKSDLSITLETLNTKLNFVSEQLKIANEDRDQRKTILEKLKHSNKKLQELVSQKNSSSHLPSEKYVQTLFSLLKVGKSKGQIDGSEILAKKKSAEELSILWSIVVEILAEKASKNQTEVFMRNIADKKFGFLDDMMNLTMDE